jgi:cell division inhibitor SulA
MSFLNTIVTPILNTTPLIKRSANLIFPLIRASHISCAKNEKTNNINKQKNHSKHKLALTNSTQELVEICLNNQQDNRWILIVDPKQQEVSQLLKNKTINPAKILKVDSKKIKLTKNNINTALSKGNCCAIVLCNTHFEQQQLAEFDRLGKQTNTQCIILNNIPTLH